MRENIKNLALNGITQETLSCVFLCFSFAIFDLALRHIFKVDHVNTQLGKHGECFHFFSENLSREKRDIQLIRIFPGLKIDLLTSFPFGNGCAIWSL